MNLGKIRHTMTFKDAEGGLGRVFDGMDVSADFLNEHRKISTVSFHYDFYTNDLQGIVLKALHFHLTGKETPEHFSNITID